MTDYRENERRSIEDAKRRINKHLARAFGKRRAHEITTTHVKAYVATRQDEKASNGTINRELVLLKRMFNLGVNAGKIARRPYIPLLEENNVRPGFFEQPQFEALLSKLPTWHRPAMAFAFITGWRLRSEVLPLRWANVDLDAGVVRLDPGSTKTKEGRVIHLTEELEAVLRTQWQEHQDQWPDCPFVFHRSGKRIRYPYVAWRKACQEAGLTGSIPHDFRRSAVRNMVRAGIPERVAMQMAGHKTRSVFDRYHIVADSDLKEAAERLNKVFRSRTATDLATVPDSEGAEQAVSH